MNKGQFHFKKLLEDTGFQLKKKFGQNFLIQPAIPARIASSSRAAAGEGKAACIEIGPGAGALTRELCQCYDKVVAIELDTSLEPVLNISLAPFDNVKIIWKDVLQVNLPALAEKLAGHSLSLCANLPYYITSPILMYMLESRIPFQSITVMMQKEVADRLLSSPNREEYGAITAVVNYYCNVKKLFDVAPGNFLPPPHVTSTVVALLPHTLPPVQPQNETIFFRVIRGAFALRRKTLLNSLSSVFPIEKELLSNLLIQAGIDPSCRGETLDLVAFCAIADRIAELT